MSGMEKPPLEGLPRLQLLARGGRLWRGFNAVVRHQTGKISI